MRPEFPLLIIFKYLTNIRLPYGGIFRGEAREEKTDNPEELEIYGYKHRGWDRIYLGSTSDIVEAKTKAQQFAASHSRSFKIIAVVRTDNKKVVAKYRTKPPPEAA